MAHTPWHPAPTLSRDDPAIRRLMQSSKLNFSDCKGAIDLLIQHCNEFDLGVNTGMTAKKVGNFVGHRAFGKALIDSGLAETDNNDNVLITKYQNLIGRYQRKSLLNAKKQARHREKSNPSKVTRIEKNNSLKAVNSEEDGSLEAAAPSGMNDDTPYTLEEIRELFSDI